MRLSKLLSRRDKRLPTSSALAFYLMPAQDVTKPQLATQLPRGYGRYLRETRSFAYLMPILGGWISPHGLMSASRGVCLQGLLRVIGEWVQVGRCQAAYRVVTGEAETIRRQNQRKRRRGMGRCAWNLLER